MRTSTPVAGISLVAAITAFVAWQGVNLWRRPHSIAMPSVTPLSVMRDLGVAPVSAPARNEPQLNPPARPAATAPVASAPAPSAPVVNAPATMASVPTQNASPPAAPPAATPIVAAQTAPPEASASPQVDETALRYFARQGDTHRLETEIARLRALYPDWTPPKDPLKAPPIADPDLDRMWRLYADGQFAAVRDAIAARQATETGWVPPKDLLDRLALADTRERLVNASDAKQYGKVVEIAAATPSLRTCGDVDVLWRVAEAFARLDKLGRALDAYRYILTDCVNSAERLATMQKAAALLPRDSLAPLFALGHSGAEGDEFRSVREDLARRAIAAGGTDAKADASEEDIATLEKVAEAGHSPADPLLLGWYFLRRDDATQAEHWFRASYERRGAADSAEGLALALVALKRPADAEAVLARWRDANDGAAKAYMAAVDNLLALQPPPVLAPEVLQRIVEAVVKQRNAAVGQELGWYSRAAGQDDIAAQWFSAALAWKPDDEPSAYGLAVIAAAHNRRDALQTLANAWGARSPRILALLNPAAAGRVGASASPPTLQQQLGLPQQAAPQAVSDQQMLQQLAAQLQALQSQAIQQPASLREPAQQQTLQQLALQLQALQQRMAQPSAAPQQAAIAPQPQALALQNAPAVAAETAAPASVVVRRPASAGGSDCGANGTAIGQGECLMSLDRPAEAAARFRAVLAGGASRDRSDAAYGLMLADLRMGLVGDAEAASAAAPQPKARAAEIRIALITQRIHAAYAAGQDAEALIDLDARARMAPEPTDMMMLRGWCYFHLRRFVEAQRVWEALAATGYDEAVTALAVLKAKLAAGK